MHKPDVVTQKAQGYSCEEQQSMTLNSAYTQKLSRHNLFNVASPCWLLTFDGGDKINLSSVTIRHIITLSAMHVLLGLQCSEDVNLCAGFSL